MGLKELLKKRINILYGKNAFPTRSNIFYQDTDGSIWQLGTVKANGTTTAYKFDSTGAIIGQVFSQQEITRMEKIDRENIEFVDWNETDDKQLELEI